MLKPPTKWEEVPTAVRLALQDVKSMRKYANNGLPVLDQLTDVMGWKSGPINENWGGPRPLTNTLIGGGLAALGGYGIGRLAENIAPDGTFAEGGPRKRFALLGGLMGAAPGLYQTFDNARMGAKPWDQWPPTLEEKQSSANRFSVYNPIINAEAMQRTVMEDIHTPLQLRAATAGLLEASSQVADRPWISASDIARVAIGTGSGTAAGYLAGTTLAALAGTSPKVTKSLQDAGWYAGLLKATIPSALNLR